MIVNDMIDYKSTFIPCLLEGENIFDVGIEV
jgi:hypothetical protein